MTRYAASSLATGLICCPSCHRKKIDVARGAAHRQRSSVGRSRVLRANVSCGSATTRMGWSLSFLTTSSAPGSITPGTVDAKLLRLCVSAPHKRHPGDAGWESEIVLDTCRSACLAAECPAVE